uniref:GG11632 n=1 Tax=Drosophila erecta TaxID=7220 RepID=B3P201_DROER
MSTAKSAAHEPTIHYLDSVLSEEEKRCAYGHQWRNISISRSGRFRSKNKKRDAVDGKFFDAGSGSLQDIEKCGEYLEHKKGDVDITLGFA